MRHAHVQQVIPASPTSQKTQRSHRGSSESGRGDSDDSESQAVCTGPAIFGNPIDGLNTPRRQELRGPTINTVEATFMAAIDDLPLPRGWTKAVRASVLHAISVAFSAVTQAWASSATSRRSTTQLQAELDRTKAEIAMLNEELSVKNDRLSRVLPRCRPHYRATDRMRILQLKAARGWSTTQTASIFAVSEDTVATWLRRMDEEGDSALVQTAEPDSVGWVRVVRTAL